MKEVFFTVDKRISQDVMQILFRNFMRKFLSRHTLLSHHLFAMTLKSTDFCKKEQYDCP